MQILIDTHILIWFLEGNNLLSSKHQKLLANSQNEVFVSIASIWEMAIKISLGKLTMSNSLADIVKQLSVENIQILPILPKHTLEVLTLPFHHRDPFDRIILAQTKIENLNLISVDTEFIKYGIKLL
jgi:PIN domain nuclease of toxin-antitoxin system